MGIDVYLEWEGKPQYKKGCYDDNDPLSFHNVMNADGVYIRESYHSQAKATPVFIPESWTGGPGFSGVDAKAEAHPLAEWDDEGRVHIPARVLRERLSKVKEIIFNSGDPYYDESPEYAQDHYRAFEAFVEKCDDLELHDIKPWIVNSY